MPIYRITDPKTNKTLRFEGAAPPPEEVIREAFSKVGASSVTSGPAPKQTVQTVPEWGAKHPILYGVAGAAREALGPVAEMGGLVAGGVLGTPLGPAGNVAGAGLGYGAGKGLTRAADVALGNIQPENLPEAIKTTAGDVKSGAMMEMGGQAVGKGLGVVTEKAIPFVREQLPARIINSLIKPLGKDFGYGKNPGRVVAEEKITANTFDELVQKLSRKTTEIGQNVGKVSEVLTQKGLEKNITVDLSDAMNPLQEAITKAQENPRTNATLITRLQNLNDDLMKIGYTKQGTPYSSRKLKNLSFNDGLEFKRDIGELTKFTGNPSDDKAANMVLKKVWGNIKDKLNATAEEVDPVLARTYKKLNEKYADIVSADIAAKHRQLTLERQNLANLPQHIGGISGKLWQSLMDMSLGSTAFKTRIAAALSKPTPEMSAILKSSLPDTEKARFIKNVVERTK